MGISILLKDISSKKSGWNIKYQIGLSFFKDLIIPVRKGGVEPPRPCGH